MSFRTLELPLYREGPAHERDVLKVVNLESELKVGVPTREKTQYCNQQHTRKSAFSLQLRREGKGELTSHRERSERSEWLGRRGEGEGERVVSLLSSSSTGGLVAGFSLRREVVEYMKR